MDVGETIARVQRKLVPMFKQFILSKGKATNNFEIEARIQVGKAGQRCMGDMPVKMVNSALSRMVNACLKSEDFVKTKSIYQIVYYPGNIRMLTDQETGKTIRQKKVLMGSPIDVQTTDRFHFQIRQSMETDLKLDEFKAKHTGIRRVMRMSFKGSSKGELGTMVYRVDFSQKTGERKHKNNFAVGSGTRSNRNDDMYWSLEIELLDILTESKDTTAVAKEMALMFLGHVITFTGTEAKKLDDDGKVVKDEKGEVVWEPLGLPKLLLMS